VESFQRISGTCGDSEGRQARARALGRMATYGRFLKAAFAASYAYFTMKVVEHKYLLLREI
jgi:hypothetical protein